MLRSRDLDELLPNKSISVLNSCRLTTPNGTVRDIKGLAFRPDDSEQGKLKVALNGVPFPPRDCKSYNIIAMSN